MKTPDGPNSGAGLFGEDDSSAESEEADEELFDSGANGSNDLVKAYCEETGVKGGVAEKRNPLQPPRHGSASGTLAQARTPSSRPV